MVIGHFIRIIYTWFLALLMISNLIIFFDIASAMPVPFVQGTTAPQGSYVGFTSILKFFQSGFTLGNSGALDGFTDFLSGFNNGMGNFLTIGLKWATRLSSFNMESWGYTGSSTSIIVNVLGVLGMIFTGFGMLLVLCIAFGYLLYFIFLICYYLCLLIEVVVAVYSFTFGYVYSTLPQNPYDYGNLPTYDDWLNQGLRLSFCF